MVSRKKRAEIASETVSILEAGQYSVAGTPVRIAVAQATAVDETQLYTPDDFEGLNGLPQNASDGTTVFRVRNCTTLAAAREIVVADGISATAVLNFASAKNPGGGFLNGSQAQEESLARASGLYPCLQSARAYYDINRSFGSCLYTDHVIWSPNVPVIRDDADQLLTEPYVVSIITAPAVNAGAVRKNERRNVSKIESVMLRRMDRVLSVAAVKGVRALVLGAWGCGVFRNDASQVAEWFHRHLTGDGRFAGVFSRIEFAVLDHSADETTFRAFERLFG